MGVFLFRFVMDLHLFFGVVVCCVIQVPDLVQLIPLIIFDDFALLYVSVFLEPFPDDCTSTVDTVVSRHPWS